MIYENKVDVLKEYFDRVAAGGVIAFKRKIDGKLFMSEVVQSYSRDSLIEIGTGRLTPELLMD